MRSRRGIRRRYSIAAVALAVIVAAGAPESASSDVDPGPISIPVPVTLPQPLAQPASQTSRPSSTPQSAPATASKLSVTATPTLRNAIVAEINRIRRAHHVRTLRVSSALVRAGTEHARALAVAGLFTHSWPDGKLFPTWIRSFYSSNGFRSWTLLLPRWREIGVGTVHALGAPGAYGGRDVDLAAAEFGTRTK